MDKKELKGNVDCFANTGRRCIFLKKLYCKENEKCSFYKEIDDLSLLKVESDIKKYAEIQKYVK